jgi:hypothetical protein
LGSYQTTRGQQNHRWSECTKLPPSLILLVLSLQPIRYFRDDTL